MVLLCNAISQQARTCDVSADGVAVLVRDAAGIQPGDQLSFALMLEHDVTDARARLEGSAMVVRVESRGSDLLVAFRAQCLSTFPIEGAAGAFESIRS
jgi:hypothetical protein